MKTHYKDIRTCLLGWHFRLLLCVLALVPVAATGQAVSWVNLKYSTAVSPSYAYVEVQVNRTLGGEYILMREVLSLHLQIDPATLKIIPREASTVELKLSEQKFQEIVAALERLSQEKITATDGRGFDGASCTLSYGTPDTDISYTIDTSIHYMGQSGLAYFFDAYKLLLRAAGLNPEEML